MILKKESQMNKQIFSEYHWKKSASKIFANGFQKKVSIHFWELCNPGKIELIEDL